MIPAAFQYVKANSVAEALARCCNNTAKMPNWLLVGTRSSQP
jgi:hypothetical protein